MRKLLFCLALVIGFLGWGLNPALGAPPDIAGTVWSGNAYVAFDASYTSADMTLEITHQRGSRFQATVTFPPPFGDGTPWPLNGIIFNDKELHMTAGKAVTVYCIMNSTTTPTRIKGYFHHLEESYSVPVVPAHTGTFILYPVP